VELASPDVVDWLSALGLAVALAACAGLRAWLPLLLAGALSRAGALELGDAFAFLSTTKALVIFAAAALLEIAADKVPALDHALDALSTLLRPAAGSLLAASAIGVVSDPLTALVLGVAVGAPSSLVPHAGKAVLRAASTTFTGGLANPVLSALEDAATVVLFVLAVVVPLLIAFAVIVTGFFVARRLARRPAPAAA
jgi:hypothetical protein